jgi:hypothetical protein
MVPCFNCVLHGTTGHNTGIPVNNQLSLPRSTTSEFLPSNTHMPLHVIILSLPLHRHPNAPHVGGLLSCPQRCPEALVMGPSLTATTMLIFLVPSYGHECDERGTIATTRRSRYHESTHVLCLDPRVAIPLEATGTHLSVVRRNGTRIVCFTPYNQYDYLYWTFILLYNLFITLII